MAREVAEANLFSSLYIVHYLFKTLIFLQLTESHGKELVPNFEKEREIDAPELEHSESG